MSILSGNRVRLRPIEMKDAEILCKWKNDESVFMYLGGGYRPISVDQYTDWMKSMIDQTGVSRRFLIVSEGGEPLGMVGLYDINWIHQTCDIGLFIGETECRGQGVATEAYGLLEQYARAYLNIRKIHLKVVGDNLPGKAFWQKMGYKEVGILHSERYINGRYCDVLIMEKFLKQS